MEEQAQALDGNSWFLRDTDGHRSSKRLAGFIALSCIVISWLLDYCGLPNGREYIAVFTTITLGCFGLAASEFYFKKDS